MHELSIVLSMMDRIREEAMRHNGTVRGVHVKIGVLSGVDCEALRFAWEVARADTELAEAELKIEKIPLLVRCPACGNTHTPEARSIFCPQCVTPEQDILEGREMVLTALEIDS